MIVTSALKLIHPQNTKQETNKIACLPYAVHVTIEAWLCLQIASKLCCLYNHFQKFKHTKYYVPFVGKKNKRENGDWWNYTIWKSIHPYKKAFFFCEHNKLNASTLYSQLCILTSYGEHLFSHENNCSPLLRKCRTK